MKHLHNLSTILLLSAVACAGTSSGNPLADKPGKGAAGEPIGITLAKSDAAHDDQPKLSGTERTSFAAGNRAFAFALYSELSKEKGNVFFSPFSISMALAMTYAGAKDATASEMESALDFGLPQPKLHAAFNYVSLELEQRKEEAAESEGGVGFSLDLVNQVWGDRDYKFLDSYLDVLAINYGAGLRLVDFQGKPEAARGLINDWVAEQTKKRVEQVLPPDSITSQTRLVLTNTIYFKSNWLKQFDPDKTDTATFHAADADRSVQMMHKELVERYAAGDNYQAVDLPYLSTDVRAMLILPNAGEFDAVAQALGSVYDAVLANEAAYDVTLSLPRFSFDSARALKAPLEALGMKAAFSAGADFSGMGGKKDLFIDEVYHSAFVAVDEHGTEAAAATAVSINADGAVVVLPTADVSFDRPFIFLIYDQPTGQILFLGRLVDPG